MFPANQPFDALSEGSQINVGGGYTGTITYKANWGGTQATSTLTGGNDMAIYNVVAVPEPAGATLLGIGLLALLSLSRRQKTRSSYSAELSKTNMIKSLLTHIQIAIVAICLAQSSAIAVTYVGIDLYTLQTPAGLTKSLSAADAFGGQVGGRANESGDNFHAILWSGPAGAAVDLTPSGFTTAQINGLAGGQQVGSVTPQITLGVPGPNAASWSGTPASIVNLNPSQFTISTAIATDGNQQVGSVTLSLPGPGVPPHATLWSGTAASAVDLHPTGYSSSVANAIRNGQQAGQAAIGGNNHAMFWTGTAASAVDLNPAGATSSFALGIGDGQQVGVANFAGLSSHAALWSGTAASFVDLSPPGSTVSDLSEALDVLGGVQVGFAQIAGSLDQAYLWTGSAASAVDLALLLPVSLRSFSRAEFDRLRRQYLRHRQRRFRRRSRGRVVAGARTVDLRAHSNCSWNSHSAGPAKTAKTLGII